MKRALLIFATLSTPVWADCPAGPDMTGPLEALFAQARAAPNEMAGRAVSDRMWQVWLHAPDAVAQKVLDQGMRRRESYDFVGALEDFTRLTEYCPLYAEGFNQRAFVHFLSEDHSAALVDLDRALSLQPRHVGAQSGRALTLINLGRIPEARAQLISALGNNPWLSERFLLADGAPLAPMGDDI